MPRRWGESQFGRRVRLFEWGGAVFATDFSILFFLCLLFLSLRLRLFPFFYTDLSSATYWGMAFVTTIGIVLSIISREMFHLVGARRLGEKPQGAFLYLFGAGAPIELPEGNRWSRCKLYLEAIGFSAFLALLCFGLAFLLDTNPGRVTLVGILFHLAAFNLTLAVFQLLPVLPLDGGRLLLTCFSGDSGVSPGILKSVYLAGNAVGLALLAAGGYSIFGQSPVLGAWFVLVGLMCLRANYEDYRHLKFHGRF